MRQSSPKVMKNTVQEFMTVTSTDRATAQRYLKSSNSNLQGALNLYFSQDYSSIDKFFDKYAKEDKIDAEGTQNLLDDLKLEYDDIVTIVISYYLKSPSMCEFTRQGFRQGCKDLDISELLDLSKLIPKFRSDLESVELFRKIYIFTFNIAKVENQKTLGNDWLFNPFFVTKLTIQGWKLLSHIGNCCYETSFLIWSFGISS
jgi:DCN1-like protein 1/2